MDTIKLLGLVEKVESIFTQIKYLRGEEQLTSPSTAQLTQLKQALNDLFVAYSGGPICTDIIYTPNYDKEFFGVMVNPLFNFSDALLILATDDPVECKQYQLEIDSKIFDMSLGSDELTSIVLFEISSMFCPGLVNEVRALIDLHVLADDDVIRIRDSANYAQLILYALKDTYYKVSSMMFKEDIDEMLANPIIKDAQLGDAFVAAQEKLINNVYGLSDTVRSPKTYILKWSFMVYKDPQTNSRLAKETLKDAKDFTASVLQKQEIDKTLLALDRIDSSTLMEGANVNKFLESKAMHSVTEASIFKSLKQAGLKSIEDDFYELSIKAKSMECEDDALFVIRSINTRLGILEDYIYNTELSDSESKRWNNLANNYRNLRDMVVKSKVFKKKSYGLFFDYNQLDQLDESFASEPVRESIFSKNVKIPKDIAEVGNSNVWTETYSCKYHLDRLVKYLSENKAPKNQLSYWCKAAYYSIMENTFANGINSSIDHGDTVSYLCSKYVNNYASTKDKNIIKEDIKNTIVGLNRIIESNQNLTPLQRQWYNDIKKAQSYL